MATKVDAWMDNSGKLHATEHDAEKANDQLHFESMQECASDVISLAMRGSRGELPFHVAMLEGLNRDALQPLADYIILLMRQSDERSLKYGGPGLTDDDIKPPTFNNNGVRDIWNFWNPLVTLDTMIEFKKFLIKEGLAVS